MTAQRFYVREHSGYTFGRSGTTAGNASLCTEVMVIDRDYGHRVIRSYIRHVDAGIHRWATREERRVNGWSSCRPSLLCRRIAAEALCGELNEWHEEAMRA